jgi:hypothetical protein
MCECYNECVRYSEMVLDSKAVDCVNCKIRGDKR